MNEQIGSTQKKPPGGYERTQKVRERDRPFTKKGVRWTPKELARLGETTTQRIIFYFVLIFVFFDSHAFGAHDPFE